MHTRLAGRIAEKLLFIVGSNSYQWHTATARLFYSIWYSILNEHEHEPASISVSNHFVVSSVLFLCVACGCVVFITSNYYSFGQMMMMMLSLHLKPSNQPANWLVSELAMAIYICQLDWYTFIIYIQHFAIHSAIYATVTATLNAEHATQEYPNRNRKLIYIFIWSLRWIIFCRVVFLSFSLPLFLSLIFTRMVLPFDGSRFFWCVAFFIQWIAKADTNRMNTKFTFGRETHTHTYKWLFSRANERKTKTKRKNIFSCTQTHTYTHLRKALAIIRNTNDMNCKITP